MNGKVLVQNDQYTPKNDKIEIGWLGLKIDKICNIGTIEVGFIARDQEGMVAVGFHYKNKDNHYRVEVYSG